MKTLAIDQGANCGWATNADGALKWGTAKFGLKRGESDGARLWRFDQWLWHMCHRIPTSFGRSPYRPTRIVDMIVFEGVVRFVEGKPNMVGPEYAAVIKLFCARHEIDYAEVAPLSLKAFAIPDTRKKVRGEKRERIVRGKPQMTAAAKQRIPYFNTTTLTDDQADALWLFWFAEERLWSRKK